MKQLKIAKYMRLSNDDGDSVESCSIDSQRSIINQYIQTNLPERMEEREYIDDGFTGLNFDRPDFKRLKQDIEKGEINTVIFKDTSRLGRDYIETGSYLRYFREKEVRVISINENYDSTVDRESDQFMIPFKTVFNNIYSIDISNKVQASFRASQREGKFTGSHAGYGFKKDPTDKHKLLIDEEVAPVIRKIFDLYIEGQGKNAIARILNQQNIPCPTEYKKMTGSNYHNSKRLDTTSYWTYSTIDRILKNEMYIGNMVLNKSKRNTPRGKAKKNQRENWIITEQTHEPIIDKAKWDLVQHLLKCRGRQLVFDENVGLFAGFIVCADCGRAMSKIQYQTTEGKCIVYVCGTYKRYGAQYCTRHGVKSEVLETAVLNKLNEYISKADIQVDAVKKSLKDTSSEQKKCQQKLDIIAKRKKSLFDSYADGIITKDEFVTIKQSYEEEEKQYKALMETAMEQERGANREKLEWLEKLRNTKRIERLDRSILAEILDKIYVKEDSEGLHVDIRFRFRLD